MNQLRKTDLTSGYLGISGYLKAQLEVIYGIKLAECGQLLSEPPIGDFKEFEWGSYLGHN